MSYGATTSEIYSTAAEQAVKILRGARPSELPIQQATRFELVINNKTAKALGIKIPRLCLSAPTRQSNSSDVSYWPLADIASCAAHVCF